MNLVVAASLSFNPPLNVQFVMEREMILRELREAEEHVATATEQVLYHQAVVDELDREGNDQAVARQLLKTFQDLLASLVEDLARIKAKLADHG